MAGEAGGPGFGQGGPLGPAPDGRTSSESWDGATAPGETFTEIEHRSWGKKLMDAIVGVAIGVAIVLVTAGVLFWNEGRAVQTARSLGEGAGLVIDVEAGRVDPANEGRLIHVQGELATGAPLADPELGVQARAARLMRVAEMLQWKEESRTETRKNVGGSEERITTYSYARVWSDRPIDSSGFRRAADHPNPPMRLGALDLPARDASLGAFRPGPAVLGLLPANDTLPLDASALARVQATPGLGPVHIQDGRLLLAFDPVNLRIGDLRVRYQVAPIGPTSLIGRQAGPDVTEFQTQAGDRLLMARAGLVPASDMFLTAQEGNRVLTWVIRVVGSLLMAIGFWLVLRPIAVAADVVPMIGSVLGAGAGVAAALLTAIVAPVVVALAWFAYRPLVAGAVLAGGVALALGLRVLASRRQSSPRPQDGSGGAVPQAGG